MQMSRKQTLKSREGTKKIQQINQEDDNQVQGQQKKQMKLIQMLLYYTKLRICTLAIKSECYLLLAGNHKYITATSLFSNNRQLKCMRKIIRDFKGSIKLVFFKKADQFLTLSGHNQILIWQQFDNNNWFTPVTQLNQAQQILCLKVSNNDDLIIIGTYEGIIKFWKIENYWKHGQTIKSHESQIYSLRLNNFGNKLLSYGRDMFLCVLQKGKNNEWRIVKKFKMETSIKLYYLPNEQFLLAPEGKNHLLLYDYDQILREIKLNKKIELQSISFIPLLTYMKKKELLVLQQNDHNLYFIDVSNKGEAYLIQLIMCECKQRCNRKSEIDICETYLTTWSNGNRVQLYKFEL